MAEILITSGLAFAGTNMDDILILQTVDKAQGSRLGFFVKRAIKLPFFRIL